MCSSSGLPKRFLTKWIVSWKWNESFQGGCTQATSTINVCTVDLWLFVVWLAPVTKGTLTLANPYNAQACLTPKVQFVWLLWVLCTVLKHSSISWPWHSWTRCASARYVCSCASTHERRPAGDWEVGTIVIWLSAEKPGQDVSVPLLPWKHSSYLH